MKSQIYLPSMTREFHNRQIDDFASAYFEKLNPVFRNIDEEAHALEQDIYNAAAESYIEDFFPDPSEIAEHSRDAAVDRYRMLSLGKYTLCAAWHATLYELFEQQVRYFLYRELLHLFEIDFATFCTNLQQIKDVFTSHNFDVERLSSWTTIDELRLLCNLIKHSDGRSATLLRTRNPRLFRTESQIDVFELVKSTLLEESLNIDEATLRTYVAALHSFWNEIPERNYAS